jgi:hypothetical protein
MRILRRYCCQLMLAVVVGLVDMHIRLMITHCMHAKQCLRDSIRLSENRTGSLTQTSHKACLPAHVMRYELSSF